MNKMILTMASALVLSAGSAGAQEAWIRSGTVEQAPPQQGHSGRLATGGAYSRNIGPGSSVSGIPEDSMGSVGSGNTEVLGAPTASRRDS
jgi:hypothetical protein